MIRFIAQKLTNKQTKHFVLHMLLNSTVPVMYEIIVTKVKMYKVYGYVKQLTVILWHNMQSNSYFCFKKS